jgi:hypothetical protein
MATIAQIYTISRLEVSYRIQEDGCDPSQISTGGGLRGRYSGGAKALLPPPSTPPPTFTLKIDYFKA